MGSDIELLAPWYLDVDKHFWLLVEPPIWKTKISQNGFIFPNFRGENSKKYLKPQPRFECKWGLFLNSFIWKTSSSPNKFFFRRTFANSMFFFRGTCWRRFFKKNVDAWYPQIVPGVWSLVTLQSAAAALKHLRSALRCWSLLTFIRSVLTQQVHSLGHLAFKWRSSFAKALAKLSPNFREKSPNSFYKMIHIYIINTKYKYLQCNLDMCTWTFAKTFARKKKIFRHFRKKL